MFLKQIQIHCEFGPNNFKNMKISAHLKVWFRNDEQNRLIFFKSCKAVGKICTIYIK